MIWSHFFKLRPIPVQSIRIGRYGAFKKKEHREYQDMIRSLALEIRPSRLLDGPLALQVGFWFHYPKVMPRKLIDALHLVPYTAKKDIDNMLKGVLDPLKGVVYSDDEQITDHLGVFKRYCPWDAISIMVSEVDDDMLTSTNNMCLSLIRHTCRDGDYLRMVA